MEIKPTTDHAGEALSFREAILPPRPVRYCVPPSDKRSGGISHGASLQVLRPKLGQKAKPQKRYRFYSLHALVCRRDVLTAAFAAVRRNDDAPGVDGMSLDQITATPESEAAFLAEIARNLKAKTYRAQPVQRVYLEKENGKLRPRIAAWPPRGFTPLGIPTVRDRVVQTAVLLILEPIFEVDFEDCSYGFRPGRSAHDALREILQHLKGGA